MAPKLMVLAQELVVLAPELVVLAQGEQEVEVLALEILELAIGGTGTGTGGTGGTGTGSTGTGTGGTDTGTQQPVVQPIVCTGDSHTKVVSPVINDVFDPTKTTTISVSIKPEGNSSTGGVFQYVGETTFTVFLEDNEIKVHAGTDVIGTGISCEADEWCDMTFTSDPDTEKMTLSVVNPSTGQTDITPPPTSIFTTSFIVTQ
ncbi:hypothetical protein DPMN_117978 [Dreissena polymorpha]|uniref:Uncharacterized protein n=1 Tax=Dreissena polymorpha TaxID=45954 RepID=A0A9D4GGJ2_DREPO|nr:hypothetical protein DPMN_117978 [Dreissena polymorpha]